MNRKILFHALVCCFYVRAKPPPVAQRTDSGDFKYRAVDVAFTQRNLITFKEFNIIVDGKYRGCADIEMLGNLFGKTVEKWQEKIIKDSQICSFLKLGAYAEKQASILKSVTNGKILHCRYEIERQRNERIDKKHDIDPDGYRSSREETDDEDSGNLNFEEREDDTDVPISNSNRSDEDEENGDGDSNSDKNSEGKEEENNDGDSNSDKNSEGKTNKSHRRKCKGNHGASGDKNVSRKCRKNSKKNKHPTDKPKNKDDRQNNNPNPTDDSRTKNGHQKGSADKSRNSRLGKTNGNSTDDSRTKNGHQKGSPTKSSNLPPEKKHKKLADSPAEKQRNNKNNPNNRKQRRNKHRHRGHKYAKAAQVESPSATDGGSGVLGFVSGTIKTIKDVGNAVIDVGGNTVGKVSNFAGDKVQKALQTGKAAIDLEGSVVHALSANNVDPNGEYPVDRSFQSSDGQVNFKSGRHNHSNSDLEANHPNYHRLEQNSKKSISEGRNVDVAELPTSPIKNVEIPMDNDNTAKTIFGNEETPDPTRLNSEEFLPANSKMVIDF